MTMNSKVEAIRLRTSTELEREENAFAGVAYAAVHAQMFVLLYMSHLPTSVRFQCQVRVQAEI